MMITDIGMQYDNSNDNYNTDCCKKMNSVEILLLLKNPQFFANPHETWLK